MSSSNLSVEYQSRLSGELEAIASDLPCIDVTLRAKGWSCTALPNLSRRLAMDIPTKRFVKNKQSSFGWSQFDCHLNMRTDRLQPDTIKDTFHQKLHEILRTTKRGEIVILLDNIDVR